MMQGVGLGLRAPHVNTVLQEKPPVPFFEALTDNYLDEQGLPREKLLKIRRDYPITLHGVGLSLGSDGPLNLAYLKKLKSLKNDLAPHYISEHLAWTTHASHNFQELLPLPLTEEVAHTIAKKISAAQTFLGERILIENISTYLRFKQDELTEWEFVNLVAHKADCYILLDINNIFVNATNHGLNPQAFIAGIDESRVKQFHLAGFLDCQTHLLDTHGAPIAKQVWDLYRLALEQCGPVPTLIEWDNNIPDFTTLFNEAKRAETMMHELCVKE